MLRRRTLLASGLALPALLRPAVAQDRPIQLMVGFAPGGNIDLAARMAAPFLEKYLGGQQIIVVNRPGAGGMIMLNDVAAAAPDGRTAALVSFPALVTALYDNRPRYTVDSFAYVGLLTDEPYTIFVGPNSPYKSLPDLIAAARAQPEHVTMAGAGVGSAPHLALMQLERAAGVRFTWVPTPGAGQAMQLVQGGHVAGSISTVSLTVRAHIQGALRVLALMSESRWDRAPDLPTTGEAGWKLEAGSARGFALPAATPAPMLQRWEDAVRRTAQDPAFKALTDRDYLILRHMDRATMTRFVQDENATYARIWRESPWRQN
ncbi:Bug family tripartite tricarboxylate transporter substrate binding protein [Falsiroseomonas selenitidurans]|uniref:Tripartite tricarboxylate transporter substrate binding protein n=1 Tax=Falsiroseomonas selenitidurans TaxID=2716335 RepID=A0ABX1E7F9_9PROT|nr:tripartite tricarboxylate transporter substrate binding protein [Falsiroseomonas selenitidurans]NKC32898.1 tripartite tricarboxylate transporter substrate binding protein [Falsiroseomonas selenitidurans]